MLCRCRPHISIQCAISPLSTLLSYNGTMCSDGRQRLDADFTEQPLREGLMDFQLYGIGKYARWRRRATKYEILVEECHCPDIREARLLSLSDVRGSPALRTASHLIKSTPCPGAAKLDYPTSRISERIRHSAPCYCGEAQRAETSKGIGTVECDAATRSDSCLIFPSMKAGG
jgi:hypothetical protein